MRDGEVPHSSSRWGRMKFFLVTAMARRVRLESPVFSSREETKRFTVREEMPSSAAISSYSSPSHTSRSTSISRG